MCVCVFVEMKWCISKIERNVSLNNLIFRYVKVELFVKC